MRDEAKKAYLIAKDVAKGRLAIISACLSASAAPVGSRDQMGNFVDAQTQHHTRRASASAEVATYLAEDAVDEDVASHLASFL
jgi:hypothetical protein